MIASNDKQSKRLGLEILNMNSKVKWKRSKEWMDFKRMPMEYKYFSKLSFPEKS